MIRPCCAVCVALCSMVAESSEVWHRLSVAVLEVEAVLRQLRRYEERLTSRSAVATASTPPPALALHQRTLHRVALLPSSQWAALLSSAPSEASGLAEVDASLVSALSSLSERFLLIRQLYREMGEASGVAIEPPSQTALCDWTLQQAGVVAAAVPGAGGEDAILVLAIVDSQSEAATEAERSAAAGAGVQLPTTLTSASASLRCRLSLAWQRFGVESGDARLIRPLPVSAVSDGGGVRHEDGVVDVSRLSIFRV